SNKDLFLNHHVNLSGLAPGTLYHLRVKATDAAGLQAVSDDYTFTTSGINQPPTVSATASPTCGPAPLSVSFSAMGSDPEGSALTYKWSFGDGAEASGANASHTYQSAGTFTAKVVATDSGGASASVSIIISVSVPAPPGPGTTYYVSPTGSDSNPGS